LDAIGYSPHCFSGNDELLFALAMKNPSCNWETTDHNENARLIFSQIVLAALNGLEVTSLNTTAQHRRELKSIRKQP
jgi:hypothetical protein